MTTPVSDRERGARAVQAFLLALGRDPEKEPELAGTGARVFDAFQNELLAGYAQEPKELLIEAAIASDAPPAVIAARDIAVSLVCPHHLLPAWGTVDVAFAPKARIVGVGAIASAAFASTRRLVLQEEAGERLADAVFAALSPSWVAVRLRLSHACMVLRGERALGATIETIAVRGATTLPDVALVLGAPKEPA